jgi:hypothetical protein
MYLQKVISKKTLEQKTYFFVGILSATDENTGNKSGADPLVSGTDPRIRIRTTMSRIHNTD